MSDPLATYLQDHLAGAAYAIDLVEFMSDEHEGEELGQFAAGLLLDIKSDRDVLRQLAERIGGGSSKSKEMAAWAGEKVSRLKLSHDDEDGMGTFEALEFLELGIHGKLELWRALGVVAASDSRLRGMDFEHLATRAATQRTKVERWRLRAAQVVFGARAYSRKAGAHRGFSGAAPKSIAKTTVGAALLALAAVAAISMAPDVVRYLKIRAM